MVGVQQGRRERPNPTAHSYVLERLRRAILDGDLPGGTRLRQVELASEFAVSITPVREALRDLAGEGLVVFDPHRGSTVRRLDLEEVREIYEMRIALEPIMVRRMIGKVDTDRLNEAERLIRWTLADEFWGPTDEEFVKIPRRRVAGDARLARALAAGIAEEVDLSSSQELAFDHGVMVPLHLLGTALPVIPIIVNCLAGLPAPLHRCHALGAALRRTVDRWPERVAVLGTGGLSHWPAMSWR